jgi:RimJ/RimL family protein N-acetyltransferase
VAVLLYGHDEAVAVFVSQLLFGDDRGFGNCRAIGVVDSDGKLIGGVVYHNWQQESGTIEMSSAATTPRWLNRIVLDAIFRYPFEIVGCQMALMRVSARNTRLHRQFNALALRRLTIPRLYGRNEDGIIFTLTDDDWSAWRFKRKAADVEGQSPITP